MKLLEQPEPRLTRELFPDKSRNRYHAYLKRMKARLERHRANRDPETMPLYRKSKGWEW